MKKRDLYVILPYIRTKKRVQFPGVELRSSLDLEGLPDVAQSHIHKLSRVFFAGDGIRIKDVTCAHIELTGAGEGPSAGELLRAPHLVITYLYSAPRGKNQAMPSEATTLFDFRPAELPGAALDGRFDDERVERVGAGRRGPGVVNGYGGRRNGLPFWCDETSRIYPEFLDLELPSGQDLAGDLAALFTQRENWAFSDFWTSPTPPGSDEVRDRVLVSLEWYARSCRRAAGDAETMAHLATALESLLKVPERPKLTQALADAVTALLGPVEGLESWFEQFYSARSKTLHEGAPRATHFYPLAKTGKSELAPHRHLLVYGYEVFRLCLTAVISSATTVEQARLAAALKPNRPRIEELFKVLKGPAPPVRRLAKARAIGEDMRLGGGTEPDLDVVLRAATELLRVFREASPPLSEEAELLLGQIVDTTPNRPQERLAQLSQLNVLLGRVAKEKGPAWELAETVRPFLGYTMSLPFLFSVPWDTLKKGQGKT